MPLSPEAFAAFRRELEADYPPPFADAAFLLQRLREGEVPLGLSAGSSPRMAPFALEKLASRGQARRPHAPPADVLASFFPGRPDYRDLMAPALAELRRRGHRVVVALPPRRELRGLDFGGAPCMPLEPFAGPARYVAARAAYARLRPDERRFAQRFGLAGDARAHLSIVLQASCWQDELFYAALRATGARAVFGLHFTLHPGFLGAIRRRRAENGCPSVTLIQHGVFSHAWETHDFFGADRVLLWGAAAAEELAAFPGATPPVTLVGHPKLDAMRHAAASRARPTGPPRVLVLGTNGVEAREREAIVLAAEALPETATRQVRFRPHPREPRTTYESLIDRGVLRSEQIEADGDVYQAVLAADLVLGTQTTLLPEAVALGVPAAQLLPERFEVDWARRGLASASTPEQLRGLVEGILADPEGSARVLEAERPLARHMLGDAEGSADRIADAVESALRTPSEARRAAGAAQAHGGTDPMSTPERAGDVAAGAGPLVTIMIPTYGQAAYLPKTIESALAQDYAPLEVVVSDDASPDATAAVVAPYLIDPRLRYVRNERNKGRVANYRDTLYQHARGTFVLNLDGDDWLADPSYLSSAMALVERNPDLAMVFGRSRTFREDFGVYAEKRSNLGLPPVCDGSELFLGYARGTVSVPHLTAVYRRDLAVELGFYRQDVIGSDSVAMLLILPGHRIGFVDRVVGIWRRHGGNATWNADVRASLANFAVVDVPLRLATARGLLSPEALRWWRRRMSTRMGHRVAADYLASGRVTAALAFLGAMLLTRPLGGVEVLGSLMSSALRPSTRGHATGA